MLVTCVESQVQIKGLLVRLSNVKIFWYLKVLKLVFFQILMYQGEDDVLFNFRYVEQR